MSGTREGQGEAQPRKGKRKRGQEDIVDGFAILAFKNYTDLQLSVPTPTKTRKRRKEEKRKKVPNRSVSTSPLLNMTTEQEDVEVAPASPSPPPTASTNGNGTNGPGTGTTSFPNGTCSPSPVLPNQEEIRPSTSSGPKSFYAPYATTNAMVTRFEEQPGNSTGGGNGNSSSSNGKEGGPPPSQPGPSSSSTSSVFGSIARLLDSPSTTTCSSSGSPRGHSPSRERDSFSSNVSSLSSTTPTGPVPPQILPPCSSSKVPLPPPPWMMGMNPSPPTVPQLGSPYLPPSLYPPLAPPPPPQIAQESSYFSPFQQSRMRPSFFPYPPMGATAPFSASGPQPPPPPPLLQQKKPGRWNAMHVRIAWEIYGRQRKDDGGGKGGRLGPPSGPLISPGPAYLQHHAHPPPPQQLPQYLAHHFNPEPWKMKPIGPPPTSRMNGDVRGYPIPPQFSALPPRYGEPSRLSLIPGLLATPSHHHAPFLSSRREDHR